MTSQSFNKCIIPALYLVTRFITWQVLLQLCAPLQYNSLQYKILYLELQICNNNAVVWMPSAVDPIYHNNNGTNVDNVNWPFSIKVEIVMRIFLLNVCTEVQFLYSTTHIYIPQTHGLNTWLDLTMTQEYSESANSAKAVALSPCVHRTKCHIWQDSCSITPWWVTVYRKQVALLSQRGRAMLPVCQ